VASGGGVWLVEDIIRRRVASVEEVCGQWRRRVASGGGVWPVEEACG
jgi:hypothetical protein